MFPSAWVASNGQSILANLSASCNPKASITTKDTFHDVSDVHPFHLPHIFSPAPGLACESGAPCAITSTDLSMPVYDSKDALDTGLYPITATEIRTKLKSRQAVWEKAGCKNVDYDSTDRNNAKACRAINQVTICIYYIYIYYIIYDMLVKVGVGRSEGMYRLDSN